MQKCYGLLLLVLVNAGLVQAQAPQVPDVAVPAPATASAVVPADKVQLGLHLQVGQTYLARITTDNKMTEILPKLAAQVPQRMDMSSSSSVSMLYAVTGQAADGTVTVKVTYHAFQFKSAGKMGGIAMPATVYDSKYPPKTPSPMNTDFGALIGQSLTMKIDTAGHIVDMQGADKIRKRLLAGFPAGLMDKATTASTDKNFLSFLSDKYFKESMGKMTFAYPPTPVSVGDS